MMPGMGEVTIASPSTVKAGRMHPFQPVSAFVLHAARRSPAISTSQ